MMLPAFLTSEPLAFYQPALHAWIEGWLRTPLEESAAAKETRRGSLATLMARREEPKQEGGSFYYNSRRPYSVKEGIAEIHVNDALSGNLTKAHKYVGMTDYADLIAELEMAAADRQVRGVLLDINSPGGSAVGAPEAAAAVAALREQKPVVSNIGRLGASAAYYIAAASNAIVASQSAIVGSIGTIMTHMELSGLLQAWGVKVNIITPAGSDLKASGNMLREMQPNERAFLQDAIERMNANFTGWVSKYRPAAKAEESMRGQWFSGAQAVEVGLADYVGGRAVALHALRGFIGK